MPQGITLGANSANIIDFKILVLVIRLLNKQTPKYLQELIVK